MKKSIISLGMAALLLVTPTPIFATNVSTPIPQEVNNIELAAASQYISNYQSPTRYSSVNSIPSTYRYTFTDSNGNYWSGSLSRTGVTQAGSDYWWYGLYSGTVYLIEQS